MRIRVLQQWWEAEPAGVTGADFMNLVLGQPLPAPAGTSSGVGEWRDVPTEDG